MKTETTPTTGVISQNSVPLIWDDFQHNAIDLDYEAFIEEHGEEAAEEYEEHDATYLIGYKKDAATGLYEPDEEAEYSAIISCPVIQVTHSKHTTRAAPCSPCYPGQADLDTSGEIIAYCLPASLFDSYAPCPYEIREN